MTLINSVFQAVGLVTWVGFAVYLLIDARRKVRLLGEKFNIFYPFQCDKCHHIKNYSSAEYMQIVKKPRYKFTTFKDVRNQYLFYCEQCKESQFQEILYQQIPSNLEFIRARGKIIIQFILKEFALGILVTAIVGMTVAISQ